MNPPSRLRARTLFCVTALTLSFAAPLAAQVESPPASRDQEIDAARAPVCEHPALAEADRLACAQAWSAATTDQDRAALTERYSAMAKGNATEGDGVPTAAPPSDRVATPAVPSGAEGDMGAADTSWLLTVGGGALILGLALAYGVARTRSRKTAAAQAAQDRGTNARYGRTPPR
jgi:hypothetical protein